jgi:hypothetical protein
MMSGSLAPYVCTVVITYSLELGYLVLTDRIGLLIEPISSTELLALMLESRLALTILSTSSTARGITPR